MHRKTVGLCCTLVANASDPPFYVENMDLNQGLTKKTTQ